MSLKAERGSHCFLLWEVDRALEIHFLGILRKKFDKGVMEIEVPKEIKRGTELANYLGLPLDQIECMMLDGKSADLEAEIGNAQRVAFIPYGTPGPYRVFLGLKRR